MVWLIILFKVVYKYFDKSITFNCFFDSVEIPIFVQFE